MVPSRAGAEAGVRRYAFLVALHRGVDGPRFERLWSGDGRTLDEMEIGLQQGAACGHPGVARCVVLTGKAEGTSGTARSLLLLGMPEAEGVWTQEPAGKEARGRALTPGEMTRLRGLIGAPEDEEPEGEAPADEVLSHAHLGLEGAGALVVLRHLDAPAQRGDEGPGRFDVSLVAEGAVRHQLALTYTVDEYAYPGGIDEVSVRLDPVPGAEGTLVAATVTVFASSFGGSEDEQYTRFYAVQCPAGPATCRLVLVHSLDYRVWNDQGCMHQTDGGCSFRMGRCRRDYRVNARVLDGAACGGGASGDSKRCLATTQETRASFLVPPLTYSVPVKRTRDGRTVFEDEERTDQDRDAYFSACQAAMGYCYEHWHEYQSECTQDRVTTVTPLGGQSSR